MSQASYSLCFCPIVSTKDAGCLNVVGMSLEREANPCTMSIFMAGMSQIVTCPLQGLCNTFTGMRKSAVNSHQRR